MPDNFQNMIRMRILKGAIALTVLLMAAGCGSHSAGASEKTEAKSGIISEPVISEQAQNNPAPTPARASESGVQAKQEMPEASHILGIPQEELDRVIGDGSAKAELDYMERMVRIVEELDSRKASLQELREPVNNAAYSARRLDRINNQAPLTDEEIKRGKALMERINVVMTRRAPNIVEFGNQ